MVKKKSITVAQAIDNSIAAYIRECLPDVTEGLSWGVEEAIHQCIREGVRDNPVLRQYIGEVVDRGVAELLASPAIQRKIDQYAVKRGRELIDGVAGDVLYTRLEAAIEARAKAWEADPSKFLGTIV